MRPLTPGSVLSFRNVLAATTLLGCMSFAVSAAPPTNPPSAPPSTPPANPNLGGPPVAPGASESEKGFDGGKQGGKRGPGDGARMGEDRGKNMAWMRTFEEIKPTLSADVQAKAEAIKTQFEASVKTWRDANADKLKALREQINAQKGTKPDKALMDQMKALQESAPKPEESQKQIFALLTEPQQADFKTKLEANEKKMKALGARRGDEEGKGDGKGGGKGKGGPGGKPGDAPPADGKDKTPPPPPFDP